MSRVTITLHVRETAPRARPFDLTRVPVLGRFLRWRHARTAIQIPMLALSLALLYDGFFGPQLAPKNLAGVLPWVHWRGFVILALLVVGNLFCLGCPFMLPRRLAKRLLPANRAWPAWLRGKWVAIGLLAAFFWAYEAFDLWASPLLTAWVVVAYFVAAFVIDGFFGGAAFCKHVCPIGQFHFVNSLASPFEVAVREPSTCADCRTKDCISGRRGPDGQLIQQGCELGLFQQRKVGNIDCTFCLDCVHACPYDNVGVLARNPLHDITRDPNRSGIGRLSRRTDIAALALVLVFGAFINAFGMVSPVYTLEQWLAGRLGTTAVSRAELLRGVRTARQVRATAELLAAVVTLPLDEDGADRAAEVARGLDRAGQTIGMADALIAGIVLAHGGALLTRNRDHFVRVPGLDLAEAGDE